jgi:regulator of replication initiation timing
MSVELKIKELLARTGARQIDEETEGLEEAIDASTVKKDTSIKAANTGDTTSPKQGDSQDASYEERDDTDENPGAKVSAGIKPNTIQNKGPGNAPNYKTVGDATSVVNMQASSGNVAREELDLSSDLNGIFGDDLSEDFRAKATSIFEAAVIARVNTEMDAIALKLQEEKDQEVEELAEQLVEKVDSFLNYVVEQWLEENTLAVDTGLRSEIAEDFIGGLKTLFQEHYIDVPEEKYDVIDELQTKAGELEDALNSSLEENMSLTKEVTELKKGLILGEMTGDLADTESEKLVRLLEGVSFESEDLFREKLKVIKENYFPKTAKSSPEEQLLSEEAPSMQDTSDVMTRYAQALSRAVKAR